MKKKNIRGKSPRLENFPLSILFVQDVTTGFKDAFVNFAATQIPELLETIESQHPFSSFGLIAFSNDETQEKIPSSEEEEEKKEAARPPIEFVSDFSQDPEVLEQFYSTAIPYGGIPNSIYGNNFKVLMAAAQANLAWPSDSVRLILQVTDKVPRFFGDQPEGQLDVAQFPSGNFLDRSNSKIPHSPSQVASSVKARGAYFASLVLSPDYLTGPVGQSWQWFNRFLGQTDDFVNLINSDGSDFAEKTLSIISKIQEIELGGKTANELRRQLAEVSTKPSRTQSTRTAFTIKKKGVFVRLGFVPENLQVRETDDRIIISAGIV